MNGNEADSDVGAVTDALLARMFYVRSIVTKAIAILCCLVLAMVANDAVFRVLTGGGQLLLLILILISLAVIVIASLVTSVFVFLASLPEMGMKYAVGHMILCIVLSFGCLLGVAAVPILVSWDIERIRKTDGTSKFPS